MLSDGTDSQRLPAALRQLEQVKAAYVELEAALATRDAEIHELRERVRVLEAMVVWCVRHEARVNHGTHLSYFDDELNETAKIKLKDGSPASILAAVEGAMR